MRSLALFLGFYISMSQPENSIKQTTDLRIVNGAPIPIDKAPYQTAIERETRHDCGGVIIARDIILTAAHCVKRHKKDDSIMNLIQESPAFYRIRVGNGYKNFGGDVYKIKQWIAHEKYDFRTLDYDVAVIRLKMPLNYTSAVQPIEVATEEPKPGDTAMVTGFGQTLPEKKYEDKPNKQYWQPLMNITIPIVDRRKCQDIMSAEIRKNMLCAGYLDERIDDTCEGDSGGPMVVNGKVAGVTSWGFGCGREGLPGIYTNIAILSEWIENAKKILHEIPLD